jgi:hypothetical protein
MIRRLSFAAATLFLATTGAWKGPVGAYFGRVDLGSWQIENPSAPPPRAEPGKHRVEIRETRRIVPSSGLDPRLEVQRANNNLDVVRHRGRVYMAWRTAPSHFAGSQTVINVASSVDEESWSFEASYSVGSDLREPRLLSLGDRVLLYVSRLGDNPFDFQPRGISVGERRADGSWSAFEPTGPDGAIAWRLRERDGEALMVLYRGGQNLYAFNGEPMTVELWRSKDGKTWRPYSNSGSVVVSGGGTEADFAIDAASSALFAVVRNEAGDGSGAGSKLCRGSALTLGDWKCKGDSRKFDSPLMFEHDGEVYLVARRNLTESGVYDVAQSSGAVGVIRNQLAYIVTGKRCALWRWVKNEDRVAFVTDLPSRGDTCFPAMISSADPERLVIYDYSSDIDGPDLPWSAGQRGATYVYRHELSFSPYEGDSLLQE